MTTCPDDKGKNISIGDGDADDFVDPCHDNTYSHRAGLVQGEGSFRNPFACSGLLAFMRTSHKFLNFVVYARIHISPFPGEILCFTLFVFPGSSTIYQHLQTRGEGEGAEKSLSMSQAFLVVSSVLG